MSPRKAKRLRAAEAARSSPTNRTRLLGVLAGGAVLSVFGAELTRVWKLGSMRMCRSWPARSAAPRRKEAAASLTWSVGTTRSGRSAPSFSCSSPEPYSSRTMSQPPMNSPAT